MIVLLMLVPGNCELGYARCCSKVWKKWKERSCLRTGGLYGQSKSVAGRSALLSSDDICQDFNRCPTSAHQNEADTNIQSQPFQIISFKSRNHKHAIIGVPFACLVHENERKEKKTPNAPTSKKALRLSSAVRIVAKRPRADHHSSTRAWYHRKAVEYPSPNECARRPDHNLAITLRSRTRKTVTCSNQVK